MDVKVALTSDAISEADLKAGRWDGAALALYLTDWSAPGELWLELARGELGTVEQEGQAFTAELRGPVAMLDGPVAPETSPRSEEHTSELQSLMRISYAVFCLKKKKTGA